MAGVSPFPVGRLYARPVRGFTLVELIITLAVAAILLSLSAPPFARSIRENRNQTYANQALAILATARSEAVQRATTVTVCPSVDGVTCSGSWADGWVIGVDDAESGTPELGAILHEESPMADTNVVQAAGETWIRFTSRGMAEASVTVDLMPEHCAAGSFYRQLTVTVAGRATVEKLACPEA